MQKRGLGSCLAHAFYLSTPNYRWVSRMSFELTHLHNLAERFTIAIRKIGLAPPPHFKNISGSHSGEVASDVTHYCSSKYCGLLRCPIVTHLLRASSSPNTKDLPLPAARVSFHSTGLVLPSAQNFRARADELIGNPNLPTRN